MLTQIRLILMFLIALFCGTVLMACGERYAKQGNALAEEINRELIKQGICKDARDCFQILPMYGEHGNQVNFNCYRIDSSNRKALAVVVELVTSRGTEITSGIPISIRAFPRPHDEYVNFKKFFPKKTILKLHQSAQWQGDENFLSPRCRAGCKWLN